MGICGSWIKPVTSMGKVCPLYTREFTAANEVKQATLTITALGVYEAYLNKKRVGEYILAPGWTSYEKRLQYQTYDVTEMVKENNVLEVINGEGWCRGWIPDWSEEYKKKVEAIPAAILACMEIIYIDGTKEKIVTDQSWMVQESPVRSSEIYHGEVYDALFTDSSKSNVVEFDYSKEILIPQEGEIICEQERLKPLALIITPKGETVLDFGQVVTGYLEFTVTAAAGDKVEISHAEVLDKEGNFYTENYRTAKAKIYYTCKEGIQCYKPHTTFFGFRYIRLDEFPAAAKLDQFTAITVHSDMKRTGRLKCSDALLNQLFDNVIWGQKGNFLDVPTDCPQRNERLGWTGDAQVFVKTASYNYDVKKFFTKWLHDLAADQGEDGYVGPVIPDVMPLQDGSAAWGDAAAICPWQIYLTYGDKEILKSQFDSMKNWVEYITTRTKDEFLWTGGTHYGDWLGLDAPSGSYKGSSREDFIASAFYAYSASLVVKAGKVLDEDVSRYKNLYNSIAAKFRKCYPDYRTQTEYVLAVHFKLAEDLQKSADELARLVIKDGVQLRTGFVGTPYLLHVLSDYGYTELAYSLLLRKEYPSWLYPVTKGATTIWEHWDGIMENGDFWSKDMNSFNHYAYGAVADWVYEKAAGIQTVDEYPGFEKVVIAPQPDKRLGWLEGSIDTGYGKVQSSWKYIGDKVQYIIETPVAAKIKIGDKTYEVGKGSYIYYN